MNHSHHSSFSTNRTGSMDSLAHTMTQGWNNPFAPMAYHPYIDVAGDMFNEPSVFDSNLNYPDYDFAPTINNTSTHHYNMGTGDEMNFGEMDRSDN